MKTLKLFLIRLVFALAGNLQAQVAVNINSGTLSSDFIAKLKSFLSPLKTNVIIINDKCSISFDLGIRAHDYIYLINSGFQLINPTYSKYLMT